MPTHRPDRPACRRTWFTRTELVIVLAVLGLIGALLVLGKQALISRIHKEQCTKNLIHIALACKMYSGDFSESFPSFSAAKVQPNPTNTMANIRLLFPPDGAPDKSYHCRGEVATYVCPSSGTKRAETFHDLTNFTTATLDYAYFGHAGTERTIGPGTPLAADGLSGGKPGNENHWRYGNVLYGDGHVGSVKGADWKQQVNRTLLTPGTPVAW